MIEAEPEVEAKLFSRYMDDIIRSIRKTDVEKLLLKANSLHPNLCFTVEMEEHNEIPFLDMKLKRYLGRVSSSWYRKPTDTSLRLSFRSCAPVKYERNTVEGMIHRIHHATSSWIQFHEGLEEAKTIWEKNQ